MHFCTRHLSAINDTLETYQFGVRSGAKSGLEANLDITEDGISIRHRGKGRQCFIKTEFALQRHQQQESSTYCCLRSRKIISAMSV
jgi:hypothetical protein